KTMYGEDGIVNPDQEGHQKGKSHDAGHAKVGESLGPEVSVGIHVGAAEVCQPNLLRRTEVAAGIGRKAKRNSSMGHFREMLKIETGKQSRCGKGTSCDQRGKDCAFGSDIGDSGKHD